MATELHYVFIYFDLTRSLASKRGEREGSRLFNTPFKTSVFGTKIQLTLRLITVARFEGTARLKFQLICMGEARENTIRTPAIVLRGRGLLCVIHMI